ncbi:MAG: hypothetical protein IT436_13200 [Phycisphaerales bacterium]|nr:hypothetical protein [Phycisphaerales bacterium]
MGRLYRRGGLYGLDDADRHGELVARDRTVAPTMLATAMKTVERLPAIAVAMR